MNFFCPICKKKTRTLLGPSVYAPASIGYFASCHELANHAFSGSYTSTGKPNIEKISFNNYSVSYFYIKNQISILDLYKNNSYIFPLDIHSNINYLMSDEAVRNFLLF